MKRPLLIGSISYVVTLAVAVSFLSAYLTAAIASTAVVAVLFLLLSLRVKNCVKVFYITAISALALASLLIFNLTTISAADSLKGQSANITATIVESGKSSSGKPFYVANVSEINGEKTARALKIRIYSSDYEQHHDYDKIRAKVNFFDDDYLSSSEKYFISNSIFASGISTGEIQVLNADRFSLFREICKFRDTLVLKLRASIKGTEGKVACGILFGKRELIDDKTIDLFSAAGISHLLAVSGLHLTIIIGLLDTLLRKLRINKHIRSVIAVFISLIMMVMTGFTPSIVRAGIMMIFMLTARAIRYDYDSASALGFSAVIILIANPYAITNTSFLLSFSATIGLIVSSRILDKIRGKFSMKTVNVVVLFFYEILKMVLPCCFAFLFTIPVTAYVFGSIAIYSPIVNVLIAPLLPVLLTFIIISAAVSFIPDNVVCNIVFLITRELISCNIWIAEKFSQLPLSRIYIDSELVIPITIVIVLLILIAITSQRPVRNTICASMLSVCIICAVALGQAYSTSDTVKVSVMDSAIVIEDNSRFFVTGYNKSDSYQLSRIISRGGNKKLCLVASQNPSGKDITSLSHFLFSHSTDTIAIPTDYHSTISSLNLDTSHNLCRSEGLVLGYNDLSITLKTYGKNSVVMYDIDGFKIAQLTINQRENLPAEFSCDLLIANDTALLFLEHYNADYFIYSGQTKNHNHLCNLLAKHDITYLGDSNSDELYLRDGNLYKRHKYFDFAL